MDKIDFVQTFIIHNPIWEPKQLMNRISLAKKLYDEIAQAEINYKSELEIQAQPIKRRRGRLLDRLNDESSS